MAPVADTLGRRRRRKEGRRPEKRRRRRSRKGEIKEGEFERNIGGGG